VYRESRSLQRDAPKRIENYESLQRLERRLTDRHEELTEAQKRAHNRMMIFRALVNVLMQKAGQYDLKGDDQIQEALTGDYANADPTEAYVSGTFRKVHFET
jgi:hypothetical protein